MDNLESQTYEVFEKDPFKYSQYQKVNFIVDIVHVIGSHCVCEHLLQEGGEELFGLMLLWYN